MATGSDTTVREAEDGDVAAFAQFFTTAWRQAGPDALGFTGATDEVIAELTTPDAVRERIGGPERRMFLAWHRERVVGFSATRRIDDATVELAGIIVLPSFAGMGIGTTLVEAALQRAREDRYRSMIVRTETSNHPARAFYERRGFAVTATDVEKVGDLVVEVWELSRPVWPG